MSTLPSRQREVRYQGAIVEGDHLLLIRFRDHLTERTFWLIPGGGIEPGEAEAECVQREMREETHLQVRVERLLLDEARMPGNYYRRAITYLCRVESGTAQPGQEPEFPMPEGYGIVEIGWFDLSQPDTWPENVHQDDITAPLMHRIRAALGYSSVDKAHSPNT